LYDQLHFHERRCKSVHANAEQNLLDIKNQSSRAESSPAKSTSTSTITNNGNKTNTSISNVPQILPNLTNCERFDVIRILRSTRLLLNATVLNHGKKNKKISENYFKEKGEVDENHIIALYGNNLREDKLQSILEAVRKDNQ
jgi:hypothetical protein